MTRSPEQFVPVSAFSDADTAYLRELASVSARSPVPPVLTEATSDLPTETARDGYRIAALLGTFDPKQLFPDIDEEHLRRLLPDCSVSTDGTASRWMLRADVRLREVRAMAAEPDGLEMGVSHAIVYLKRIGSTPDHVTRALLSIAGGRVTAGAMQAMSKPELAAMRAVVSWLQPLEAQLRFSARTITNAIKRAELLEPFRFLTGVDASTGGDTFVGRGKQLRQLREFTDVLRSEGLGEMAMRGAARVAASLTGTENRILCLSGVGGVGKSTLLAKFILQHVDSSGDVQLTFAYLDLDRSTLNPTQPVTLLLEILNQLGWQVPEARESLDEVGRRLMAEIESAKSRGTYTAAPVRGSTRGRNASPTRAPRALPDVESDLPEELIGPSRMTTILYDTARALETVLAPETPLLLVVDTFEEAQAHGDHAVTRVEAFFEMAQQILRRVRVVIAGRDELDGFFGSAERLTLTEFSDDASRVAFLERRGVDTSTARAIARHVGGRPLSLHLAARLVREHGRDAISVSFVDRFKSVFDATLIDGILYKRILDHIKDKDVKAMVHPGLVLRRLDVGVLRGVVAPVLDIPDMTEERARRMLATLSLQKDLIRTEPDGSVTHRADVRQQMLKLMSAEKPTLAVAMHTAAAEYYAERQRNPDTVSRRDSDRIEEIYHRLSIGDARDMPGLWIPSARSRLSTAMPEITDVVGRSTLKVLLGQTPNAEELRTLSDRMVHEYAVRAIASATDEQDPDRALSLVETYRTRLPADLLRSCEPRALDLAGEWDRAAVLFLGTLDRLGVDPNQHDSLAAADFFERTLDASGRIRVMTLLFTVAEGAAATHDLTEPLLPLLQILSDAPRRDPISNWRAHSALISAKPMLMNWRRESLALFVAVLRLLQRRGITDDAQTATSFLRDMLRQLERYPYPSVPSVHEKWLLTLSDDVERNALELAQTLAINDTERGQLLYVRALIVDADGRGHETLVRACDVLSQGVTASDENRVLLARAAEEGVLAKLLRHVVRPGTPQWYVPIACQIRRSLGRIVALRDIYIPSLPELPFQVQSSLDTTRAVADLLGRLDQLGVLQLCLEHGPIRTVRHRNPQLAYLIDAYAALRRDMFSDVDSWFLRLPRIRQTVREWL